MKRIPMLLLPYPRAKRLSKRFRKRAERMVKSRPALALSLSQSRMDLDAKEYMAVAIFGAVFNFLLFTPLILLVILMLTRTVSFDSILLSVLFGGGFGAISFVFVTRYPSVQVSKRARKSKTRILFVLRDLLIKLKSGISLYDAIVGIATAEYGVISEEFKITSKEISAGIPQVEALERMALRNPSEDLRRVIWQLANAIRAGADVTNTIIAIVDDLGQEQRVKIKNFGAELNPLAMVYMMMTIILPTMGTTFLMILSSFASLPINETIFYMILLMLLMFQVMFLGMVRTRREEIVV
jgi:pilus assembly protein TadC